MARVAALAFLLSVAMLTPAAADKDHVSDWLVEGRPKMVEAVTAVKLAMLCQRLPARLDRPAFEDVMARRVGATAPWDRSYAVAAISEGEALALADFKYAAMTTCMNLKANDVSRAADVLAGRATLRVSASGH